MPRSIFKGQKKQRAQNSRFLVVSEGEVTERQYLEAVRRSRRVRSADLVFVPPGPTSPVEIVKRARDLRQKAKFERDPYDSVWCIFDVESRVNQISRPRLAEAVKMALDFGVSIALSNPCFELWILLHRQSQQAWIDSHRLQRLCSSLGLTIDKGIQDADQILEYYGDARDRAEGLDEKHDRESRNRLEDRNPSSGMYKLVDAIYAAFPPYFSNL